MPKNGLSMIVRFLALSFYFPNPPFHIGAFIFFPILIEMQKNENIHTLYVRKIFNG